MSLATITFSGFCQMGSLFSLAAATSLPITLSGGETAGLWGIAAVLLGLAVWTQRKLVNELCRRGAQIEKIIDWAREHPCILTDPNAKHMLAEFVKNAKGEKRDGYEE